MPLNADLIVSLEDFVNGRGVDGEVTLNEQINDMVSIRENMLGLLRINLDVDEASCMAVLATAKRDLLIAAAALNALVETLP